MTPITKENCPKGTTVICSNTSNIDKLLLNATYITDGELYYDNQVLNVALKDHGIWYAARFVLAEKSITENMKNITSNAVTEVKQFCAENRSLIYWVAILIVVDQYIFEGKFRDKLKELFESVIIKVKEKLNNIKL